MAKAVTKPDDLIFQLRLARSAPDLWPMLDALYGSHPAYDQFRQDLLSALAEAWKDRPADLKQLDLARDLEPDWFQRADDAPTCPKLRPERRRVGTKLCVNTTGCWVPYRQRVASRSDLAL